MTEALDDPHKLGKLTSLERALLLCDEGSFQADDDNTLTGRGCIHGRPVFIFSSSGFVAAQAERLIALHQEASRAHAPLVGFFDSDGHILRDDLSWFQDYEALLQANAAASGKSFRLAIVAGPCIGADAILAASMGSRFAIAETARVHVTGPTILDQFSDHPTDDTFGRARAAAEHGLVDAVFPDEVAAIAQARRLVDLTASGWQSFDTPDRQSIALEKLVPDDEASIYDMHAIIAQIVDEGDVLELSAAYAANILTCLARLDGQTVGIIANQPGVLGGALDVNALRKMERFHQLCVDHSWPVVTLIDTPGFLPQADQETQGLALQAAASFRRAKSPRLSLVVGQAFGAAFSVMAAGSHRLAWPNARFGMVKHADAIHSAVDAKAHGLVADVIAPRDTRAHLIATLSSLRDAL